jgi:DNA transposition AAA+ family ATPase
MGVITGVAGVGKTIALQYYLDSLTPHAQTALPVAVKVKVRTRSSPRALAINILESLQEQVRGRNIYEIADEAAAAMERNYIRLLAVDEADRLNDDSFEVLRHLYDKTGCRIVLVGLPNILTVIEHHQKFSSRVGLRMPFVPLEMQEVLDVILPQLVFPHWAYDPHCSADRELGTRIWRKVNPSLRNLTTLLATASQMARDEEMPSITSEIIEEAYLWMMTQQEQAEAHQAERDSETESKGEHERKSEERHQGKEEKKKSKGDRERASEEERRTQGTQESKGEHEPPVEEQHQEEQKDTDDV